MLSCFKQVAEIMGVPFFQRLEESWDRDPSPFPHDPSPRPSVVPWLGLVQPWPVIGDNIERAVTE